ncbi:SHOCT domain-containing protein [Leifsonia sp. A12D58]|uniref:SHOCT domain-containing protein n=1 Tax=Leifsonia sp. A12D58 TaxID=3397674 RepID=UPI0039E1C84D
MNLSFDFWDLVGWFLSAFIFIAYLMVLFSILRDIFQDRNLNGFLKAIWIIFLIFVPFLTALVYLIVRGTGMANRSMNQSTGNWDKESDSGTAFVSTSAADQIAHAKALLDAGAINQTEYEQLKSKALAD